MPSAPSCPSIFSDTSKLPSNPPQHSISLRLENKRSCSPSAPSSHTPLSCATVLHKYINLVSVSECVCGWVGGWGMPTYRRWVGKPTCRPLSCVTRSQTLSVYTPDPSRHRTPLPPLTLLSCPPESVTLAGEAWGQRLGVNPVVVVPDWLFDLTDCH